VVVGIEVFDVEEERDKETTCRCREDRQPRSFWEPLTAEVAILAFLHIGGQVCANPSSLPINDALFLELADSRLPTLDRSRMVRIFRRLRFLAFGMGIVFTAINLARMGTVRPFREVSPYL
jgi:hypothetical protein